MPLPPPPPPPQNRQRLRMQKMPMAPDNPNSSANKKAVTSSTMMGPRPSEHGVKCPRCGSGNTKFCYYNNYSPSQPRHFCKTCRRYWTKGGALRNVPVGGGCRKSKKSKSSSSPSFSSSSAAHPQQFSTLVPSHNYAIGTAASCIESLSSINQDLHWKLQQQRLQALLYGGGGDQAQNVATATTPSHDAENQQLESIYFHQLGSDQRPIVNAESTDNTATAAAWFLENPYSMHNASSTSTNHHRHHHTAASNSNSNSTNNNASVDHWSGIMQTSWSDMHHFTAPP